LPVDPNSGANLTVTEAFTSGWNLSNVACVVEDKVPPGTGSADLTNLRINQVSIQSGKVTTCTFTNTVQTGTLIVIKAMTNDNGGSAVAGDFAYDVGDGSGLYANETGVGGTGTSYTLSAGTGFNVVENAGGPAGYTA